MTPLARVLECCAGCGRELDLRKSMAVVDGVTYCGHCQWLKLVGPDLRPRTPPPHFAHVPALPLNALAISREADVRIGRHIMRFVEYCKEQEQDLPNGAFG